jgi:hypothetical protein
VISISDWSITKNKIKIKIIIKRYVVISLFGLIIELTRGELRAKDMG